MIDNEDDHDNDVDGGDDDDDIDDDPFLLQFITALWLRGSLRPGLHSLQQCLTAVWRSWRWPRRGPRHKFIAMSRLAEEAVLLPRTMPSSTGLRPKAIPARGMGRTQAMAPAWR